MNTSAISGQATTPSPSWQTRAARFAPQALLLLAAVLFYAPFASSPPFFDDTYMFNGPQLLANGHIFAPWKIRWLPYATFGWEQMFLSPEVVWFHLGNMLIHALNALLLMALLKEIYAHCLGEAPEGTLTARWTAFFGALLFEIHPAAVYAVSYLNQRSTLLATFFCLLFWFSYLKGLKASRWTWLAASAASYAMAILCKEHAVMAPAIAAALTVLTGRLNLATLKKVAPAYVLYALAAIGVVLQVKGVIGAAYQFEATTRLDEMAKAVHGFDPRHAYLLSVVTEAFLFFKYWFLWLIPNPGGMAVDMYEPFAASWHAWPQFAGLVGFIVYGAIGVRLLFKKGAMGLLGFAMLTPWLLYATEFSTVRIQDTFVLYRSYLWMTGAFAALPLLLRRLPAQRAVIYAVMAVALLTPITFDRLQSLSHPWLVWDDAVHLAEKHPALPGEDRLYYNRGLEAYRLKHYKESIADYTRATELAPMNPYPFNNRGASWLALHDNARALADFNHTIALTPTSSLAWYGRGETYLAMGRTGEAVASLKKACEYGSAPACKMAVEAENRK